MTYDLLIKGAKIFNNQEKPVVEDIAIKDGKIAARGTFITDSADRVIDATGLYAMPGLFDIHTHYDLELEVAPGLPESTRHGTTSVVISNCSLGLAFGSQRRDGFDPIVDCYARVENMPKRVLRACADKVDWSTPQEYIEHLDAMNMGPNVITMIPHSMLRIEVMGFDASVNRDTTADELQQMCDLLSDGLKMGYAGFSTDALPFHYLANQPNTHKTIPTQFAKYSEIKKLTNVVREHGAIWQATPPKDSPYNTLKTFLLTSGRLNGKPLKTTVVAALDVHANRRLVGLAKTLSKVLNSKLLGGEFYMQALGAPFKIWSDGAVTPIAEEIPELRALNETDLDDRPARQIILDDPQYRAAFRAMWMKGKIGFSLARLKRLWRLEDFAFDRNLESMTIELCPFKEWQTHTFDDIYRRALGHFDGATVLSGPEADLLDTHFSELSDEADFMLAMLKTFDTDLSWSTVTANRDPKTVRDLLMNPLLLPGFNDSGAHLTNMAFYDVNLRCLKLAAEGGEQDLNYMVKRLTVDPAKVFGVDRGTIYKGDVADLILIDPKALADYDGEGNVKRVHREEFENDQLVNRSDGVVSLVLINGQLAWENGDFTAPLGKVKMGELLRPVLNSKASSETISKAQAA